MFLRMKLIVAGLIVSLVLTFSSTGLALNIVLNDITPGGMSTTALNGFADAASLWENTFSDPVTVRLDVGFQSLDPGILGSTGSNPFVDFYSNVRTALNSDQTSTDDSTAVANLQAGDFLDFLTTDEFGALERDNDTGFGNPNAVNNRSLNVNRANAKALGLLSDDGITADGDITFSDLFTWDFNPDDGITGGAFDFVGVAAHEIGHALGYVSGVDTVDITALPNGPFAPDNLDGYAIFSVLDMYRYSVDSLSEGVGILDLAVQNTGTSDDNPFFSIDGGLTNLATYSTGRFNGDGRQASHWKDNLGLGIMDPTAASGEFLQITSLDELAFDVIGWDLAAEPIPEPATLILLGIGLAGLWGMYFRKRSKSKETSDDHSGVS